MSTANLSKFYPARSVEAARLLGLVRPEEGSAALGMISQDVAAAAQAALPSALANASPENIGQLQEMPSAPTIRGPLKAIGRFGLSVLPYVIVFALCLVVYYAFIADASNRPRVFGGRETETSAVVRAKAVAESKEISQDDYEKWIKKYYSAINDPSVLEMDFVGVNKLTNFENYLLELNPKENNAKSFGGKLDAELVLEDTNPLTGQQLRDWQRDVVAQYFDLVAIKSRLARPKLTPRLTMPRALVAAASDQLVAPVKSIVAVATIQDRLAMPKITPRLAMSRPKVTAAIDQPVTVPVKATTVAIAHKDCVENRYKINLAIPGRLEVPSLGINVPIIWTQSEQEFDKDLKLGVVHYPCTPMPGDLGTTYISGHSSNYKWVKSEYNQIFAKLDKLPEGATFKITAVGPDGKDIKFHYLVKNKQIFQSTDQSQFANTAESVAALSTCWPINTYQKRLVAFAKLDRVD